MKPLKVVVEPTNDDVRRYCPTTRESRETEASRDRVYMWMQKSSTPKSPAEIARGMGGNFYDQVQVVRKSCLALWAMGSIKKIRVGGTRNVKYYGAR